MSTWIDIITWDIEPLSAHSCATSSNPEWIRQRWGVCNFPARRGGCRPEISGSAGAMNSAAKTCKKSSATAVFLIFPWVQVKNLASAVLALAAKKVSIDWFDCYGCRPVLMETLVDGKKYNGTCYQAANWVHVGGNHRPGPDGSGRTNAGGWMLRIFISIRCQNDFGRN